MSRSSFGNIGECDIRQTTRDRKRSRVPFARIKGRILGKHYSLSVVLIGDALAKKLNIKSRGKAYSSNVLSFPLTSDEGEVFINLRKAGREAKTMRITTDSRVAHLFIHGCLHLKGIDHSDKMDALERKYLAEFGFKKY